MRPFGGYVVAALLIAIVTHFAIVIWYPTVIMNGAIDRLSNHGAHTNSWRHAERVSETSRTIVRPSPDLQYSACAYDLGQGPVVIRVGAWPSYWSVSLYAANSDNFFVLDDREAHDGAEIFIVRPGQQAPEHAARVVVSPTQRGVALVRRLAPTATEFDEAMGIAQHDACAPVR
jgi:uncharacterized membrane protein